MTGATRHGLLRRGLLRPGAAAVVLGLVTAGTLLAAGPASAHDYVVASDPGEGAVVEVPLDEVSYTFNAPILDLSGTGSSNVLEVVGPDGLHHETACVATVSGATASVPVALGGAGTYTSTYQVVSSDGHTVSDSQTFEYAPPEGTPAAEGSATRPTCDDAGEGSGTAATDAATEPSETTVPEAAGPEMTTQATPAAEPDAGTGADAARVDAGLVVGVAVAIVVLALAAVAIVLLTARRRGRAADGPRDAADAEGGPTED
ncbi:copper resistance CopC family protein [Frigoribacterium salinisoli]